MNANRIHHAKTTANRLMGRLGPVLEQDMREGLEDVAHLVNECWTFRDLFDDADAMEKAGQDADRVRGMREEAITRLVQFLRG